MSRPSSRTPIIHEINSALIVHLQHHGNFTFKPIEVRICLTNIISYMELQPMKSSASVTDSDMANSILLLVDTGDLQRNTVLNLLMIEHKLLLRVY